jgi:hypothetical integral membrane protein (TIGR02206 family)
VSNLEFRLWGPLHQGVLGALVLGIVLVIWLRNKKWLRYGIAAVLILQFLIFTVYHLLNGSYDVVRFLPLHLCTVSALLVPWALVSKNTIAKDVVLFWGLIPALLAIVLPDMGASDGLNSFRFWEFFTSHIFIILGVVYLSIHDSSKFALNQFSTWRKIFLAFILLILYAFGIVYPINHFLKSNYLYLSQKASVGMDFIPNGPLYLPSMLFLAFSVFIVTAVLYWLVNWFKKFKN